MVGQRHGYAANAQMLGKLSVEGSLSPFRNRQTGPPLQSFVAIGLEGCLFDPCQIELFQMNGHTNIVKPCVSEVNDICGSEEQEHAVY